MENFYHQRLNAYAYFHGQVRAIHQMLAKQWIDAAEAQRKLVEFDEQLTAALEATTTKKEVTA